LNQELFLSPNVYVMKSPEKQQETDRKKESFNELNSGMNQKWQQKQNGIPNPD